MLSDNAAAHTQIENLLLTNQTAKLAAQVKAFSSRKTSTVVQVAKFSKSAKFVNLKN